MTQQRKIDTSFLANLTTEQFHVVWEALSQFSDNTEYMDDGMAPSEVVLADDLIDKCSAAFVNAHFPKE